VTKRGARDKKERREERCEGRTRARRRNFEVRVGKECARSRGVNKWAVRCCAAGLVEWGTMDKRALWWSSTMTFYMVLIIYLCAIACMLLRKDDVGTRWG
jgi:hypothetical protein